jgi:osomolarity two-component system phosphorelay intermediate protein YPD1
LRQSGDIMSIPGAEDQIDPATFEQILEMDEDEVEREFSKSIVYDFFGQADQTFKKMDKELWVSAHHYDVHLRLHTHAQIQWLTHRREKKEGKYLKELSELGHFLKGSSATLGLTKVKDSCEKIQHYGQLKDDSGTKDITEEQAQEKLGTIIQQAKTEFTDVKEILKEFYKDDDEDAAAEAAA